VEAGIGSAAMRTRLMPAVLGAAALAALVGGGCALGPDYRRPATSTPAAYRFERDMTADSVDDAGWWRVYRDPVLQSLIRDALADNFDVRIAAARIDQARAALGSAHLQQLPQAAINAAAERQRTSVYELPPGFPAVSNVFSLEGSLSYEVDFWGKYRRATEAARAELLQSTYAKQDVTAAMVAGVATAYFTLQALDEQLAITQRTVGTRQKFVDLTQAQHDRGTVSELDVATAQAQLAVAKANVPDLMRRIGQTEDQLSLLLGRNPEPIVRSVDRALPPTPAPGLPSSLLERRPDLREAEQNLVAANAQVGVAKANLFPSITLTALDGGVSTALSSLFSGPARTWSMAGGLVQPLLNPQRNLYQLELADAQKRQALLQYQKSVQTAFQEVSDALIARQQDADVQAAQEAQVDAQRRANTIALARYRVGYASYFNVIDADRDLFTAELSLSEARLSTLLSVVQLYRALGGGWQTEEPASSGAHSP
jgi:multidrug efflux system outer membrane protein